MRRSFLILVQESCVSQIDICLSSICTVIKVHILNYNFVFYREMASLKMNLQIVSSVLRKTIDIVIDCIMKKIPSTIF